MEAARLRWQGLVLKLRRSKTDQLGRVAGPRCLDRLDPKKLGGHSLRAAS